MEGFLVATSYAPGHNFWPGTPFSWWVRGFLGFMVVAGPQLVAMAVSILKCRRARRWHAFAIGTAVSAAIYMLWPYLVGLSFRDGDKPLFIGLTWGDRVRPWLLLGGVVGSALAIALRPPEQRGFPVTSRSGDDAA